MYISQRDFDIFRLLRWCRYVSKPMLEAIFSFEEIACLIRLKIITHHLSSDSVVLTKKGDLFFDELDEDLPKKVNPAYRSTDTLRRLRRSVMMLTFYEAGLSIFHMNPTEIGCEDGFCLSSVTKGQGSNLWGNSRIAGLMTIDDTAFAVHYVCPNIGRITLSHELNTLSMACSPLGRSHMAFFFVGETYAEVMQELNTVYLPPNAKAKRPSLIHYKEAFERNIKPVHLLTCGRLGALQLKIMRCPEHYSKLAQDTLGDAYEPPSLEDDCDARYMGNPFYVAVDMNLSRLDRACTHGFIYILALEEQAVSVLIPRYAQTGRAKVYGIPIKVIEDFFGGALSYAATSEELYRTKNGDVVYAPYIQAHTKSIDPSGKNRVQVGTENGQMDGQEQA